MDGTPILRRIVPLTLILVALAPASAGAAALYSVTDLGANATDLRMNNSGQVIGYHDPYRFANPFLYSDGQFTSLPAGTRPLQITEDGRVIDGQKPNDFYARTDTWVRERDRIHVDPPRAANEQGQMVGTTAQYNSPPYGAYGQPPDSKGAYLFDPNQRGFDPLLQRETPTSTASLSSGVPGALEVYPNAINNSGVVAG